MELLGLTDFQTIVVVFITTLLLVIYVQDFAATRGLPPGPWGFPLVGHLPLLGKMPHLTFTRMYKKYGPVFRIRMGSRSTVVISGYDAIKQALVDKAIDFAGRPNFESNKYVAKGTSFGFESYSPRWRLHRKIATTGLRMFSTNRKPPLDDVINEEARQLVQDLQQGENGLINPSDHVNDAIASIILVVCFGSRFEYRDDPDFQAFNRTNFEFAKFQSAGGNPGDLMPWARPFTRGRLRKFIAITDDLMKLVMPRLETHRETFQEGELRDAMDSFIQAAKDTPQTEKDAVGLTDEAILLTVASLIGPGLGTVATTLNWALIYMALNPEVQKKVQAEIDDVIGNARCPTSVDRGKLPYTEACILEIYRCSSIAPLGFPHATTTDTSILGYRIPKDTMVFINLWSVSRDDAVWESPEEFRPERFLSEDGLSVDKVIAEKFWPFSVGKRRCIGEHLARLEVFLFFVNLMQRCRFKTSPQHPISLEPVFGLALEPQPYKIIIQARA